MTKEKYLIAFNVEGGNHYAFKADIDTSIVNSLSFMDAIVDLINDYKKEYKITAITNISSIRYHPVMKTININDLDEISKAVNKNVEVTYNVDGQNEKVKGVLAQCQFNIKAQPHDVKTGQAIRIVIKIPEGNLAIPLKTISSIKIID